MRSKKGQTGLWIIGSIVFIAVLLLAFGVPQEVIGGFQTLSIDNVQVEGDGDRIIVTGVAGTGADNLNIDFSEDDLNSELRAQGFRATDSVSGQIRLESQEVRFPIRDPRTNEQFIALDERDFGGTFGIGECPSVSGYEEVGEISTSTFDTNKCIYRSVQGLNSEFIDERTTSSEVSVELEGFSDTINPSEGENTVRLGDNQITWSGSLSNFREINAPSYNVLFQDGSPEHLITDGAYSQYVSAQQSLISNINAERVADVFENTGDIPTSPAPRASAIESAVSVFNGELSNQILSDRNSEYENSIPGSVSFEGQNLVVDAAVPVQFPQITLTLDADEVGIERLEGQPNIVSVPSVNIDSGETEQASIQIENTGSEGGQFTVSASCDQGFSATGSSGFIDAGETNSLTLSITGTNIENEVLDSSCDVVVDDQNSGNSDSATLSGSIEPVEESQPGGPIPNETDSDETPSGDCSFGQTLTTTEQQVGAGPLRIGGIFGLTETVTETYCKTQGWVYAVFAVLGIGAIIAILRLTRRQRMPLRRNRRRRR